MADVFGLTVQVIELAKQAYDIAEKAVKARETVDDLVSAAIHDKVHAAYRVNPL